MTTKILVPIADGIEMIEALSIVDGKCITSRGAATAVDSSLELLERVMGEEKKKEVARAMVADLD